MNVQHLFEEVVHRAEQLLGQGHPPTDDVNTDDARYVAGSGSSWSIEELTALARDALLDVPED